MNKLYYFSRPSDSTLTSCAELSNIWHQIAELRYSVFSEELHQYSSNAAQELEDPGEHFIALASEEQLIGYVSINSPSDNLFRMNEYFGNDIIEHISNSADKGAVIHEVRGLTVNKRHRTRGLGRILMLAALKFSYQNGADNIIAMGHESVLPMYQDLGMHVFSEYHVKAGEMLFFPMIASVIELVSVAGKDLDRIELISLPEDSDACYHGGASWDESGFDFNRRSELVVADVLDSPFPPAPEVMEVISQNLVSSCHESPPTQCEPLIQKIAEVRGIPQDNIIVSSGSSSLMFSLMPRLINQDSKVLILSPMYGEYLHILTHLITCNVTHFPLYPDDGFTIDEPSFVEIARTHDAVIIVNPNSPTGVYCDGLSSIISQILSNELGATACKMIWVDETYIEYISEAESLESMTSAHPELIICKSMSKCYALSGLRVAYAVSSNAANLRRYVPPWAVSLPAQIGAIAALSNPQYYAEQYSLVHKNRAKLNDQLITLGFTTYPSVANYILTKLPDTVAHSSNQFIALCRDRDIFIRDAENMGLTLDSRYVRFAVKSDQENEKIIKCLNDLLHS